MQHTGTTASPQDPTPEAGVPYPHRIRFEETGRHGIILGHEPDTTDLVNWVHAVVPGPVAKRVEQIAVALVSNAHKHTRSGDPGGNVRVVIGVDPFLIRVAVTDNGPRRDTVTPYPRSGSLRLSPLPGLHLVEQLAICWDWDWEWKGAVIGPLTIRAVVENP
ncbi:ATP-binding protein [Nocardiopsis sp. CT-R113]|uniref:ATP-binding protein n=1 Tax=Nocardiopsis codii TaxID=3065942 RepID=A0ABU7K7U6_9ACTN|nr:ATP-binding protein [Nocardiopsis sp. CT-R113]MEE2037964.1 ATP-binding protein [Nocardiopsis sp. CT-R113]